MKPSATPLISVSIPVFNCEDFIGQAIESVLRQSYANFELVIIDDNSTDKTIDVARRYSDPRIRLVRNEARLGHQDNWNKALEEAKGEYIKLLPADDLLYPCCLERELEVFLTPGSEDIALVCCSRKVIDDRGKVLLTRSFGNQRGRLSRRAAVRANVRAGTNLIGEPAAVLFRSKDAREIGRFTARYFYVIDLDYWVRLLAKGDIFIIPEALCAFRVARGSASLAVAASQSTDFKGFIDYLGRDRRATLTLADRLIGKSMATANRIMRQLFYRFLVKNE